MKRGVFEEFNTDFYVAIIFIYTKHITAIDISVSQTC